MATAVLRSHDALGNRMHLDAFSPSPAKIRRRRQTKPAAASASPPRKMPAVTSPPATVASPPPKAAAATQGRRSPPARSARKQASPTKEVPKQRLAMEDVRILRRGEEPPAPAPAAVPVVAQAVPVDRRVPRGTSRNVPKQPAVVPTKIKSIAVAASYAGPAFSSASPEPSSLPYPAFIRRAEAEATRGLRCLLRIGELP
ncbi:hypothetical protein ABZP36_024143 [Zizania latifolia]